MPKQFFIEAQLKKNDDGGLTFVASDETLDRSGEVIPIDSWNLDNFKKNPVLLVNHDYQVQNIVGMARNIRKEAKKLIFDPVFHGITQLSREVKEMVEAGFLNTVSVGFMPHGPEKDGDRPTNELFEISFVPVPANPSAERLNAVMAKSIKDDTEMKSIEDWITEQGEEKEAENEDECEISGFSVKEEEQETEETEVKEGRVLSGKNRKLINEAVSTLKTAAAALDELLNATETNTNDGKAGDDIQEKGREPKVVYVQTEKETPVPSAVIRALQDINRLSNGYLRKYKK